MHLLLGAALIIGLAAGTAWAQQPAQPSSYTCSFMKGRCDSGCSTVQKAGQCQFTCQTQFDKCMQTGTWVPTQSNVKTFTNVIKQ
jgi:hypothetical protein